MSSIRSYSRRAGSLFAVAALVLATITPGLVPTLVSAAQLTERSIELSSAAANADNVTYKLSFTPATNAGALVLTFCSNSPLIEAACDVPAGFDVAGAAATQATGVTTEGTNVIFIEDALVAGDDTTTFDITSIDNPTAAGPLYARMLTYTDATVAGAQYTDAENTGTSIDQGGAAISILDRINVSGAVLETLTFCVAGPTYDGNGDPEAVTIADGCTGSLPAPTLKLGKKTGSVIALDSNTLSTGSLYSQLSTNAASGAVVNLKSNAAGCGGLLRLGDEAECDIEPALAGGVAAGQARFGVLSTATGAGIGDLLPVQDSNYNASTYALNYASGQATGVTSPYGDPFLDTRGAPASNKNATITFGASIAPNTPAGNYSAELSLIATGKF